MTNPLKGEVSFKSGEDEYRLVFTIDALIALEEKFDRSVQQIGQMLGENLRMADLRSIFAAGLAEYHSDLDERAAGRLMSEMGLAPASTIVGQAFVAAFGGGEAEASPGGAQRPRKRAGTGEPVSTSGLN
jgi:hypothetical protein